MKLECHSYVTIFAFYADHICMKLLVVPNSYQKITKHFQWWMKNDFLYLCMKIYILPNSLEVELLNFIKDKFWPMVLIYDYIWFNILQRQLNTLMEIIFIIYLVHVRFKLFNNGWVINVVNSTIYIFWNKIQSNNYYHRSMQKWVHSKQFHWDKSSSGYFQQK